MSLSTHVISNITKRNNVKKKIEQLYRYDIRCIHDLLLLHPKYRFFKKKIKDKDGNSKKYTSSENEKYLSKSLKKRMRR